MWFYEQYTLDITILTIVWVIRTRKDSHTSGGFVLCLFISLLKSLLLIHVVRSSYSFIKRSIVSSISVIVLGLNPLVEYTILDFLSIIIWVG